MISPSVRNRRRPGGVFGFLIIETGLVTSTPHSRIAVEKICDNRLRPESVTPLVKPSLLGLAERVASLAG